MPDLFVFFSLVYLKNKVLCWYANVFRYKPEIGDIIVGRVIEVSANQNLLIRSGKDNADDRTPLE